MVQLVTLGTNVTPHLHGYYTKFSVKMANKFHQQAEGILLSCLQPMCSPSLNSTSWLQTNRNPPDIVPSILPDFCQAQTQCPNESLCAFNRRLVVLSVVYNSEIVLIFADGCTVSPSRNPIFGSHCCMTHGFGSKITKT